MQTALALKKSVNQALLDLHKVAASHGDEQVGTGMTEMSGVQDWSNADSSSSEEICEPSFAGSP